MFEKFLAINLKLYKIMAAVAVLLGCGIVLVSFAGFLLGAVAAVTRLIMFFLVGFLFILMGQNALMNIKILEERK